MKFPLLRGCSAGALAITLGACATGEAVSYTHQTMAEADGGKPLSGTDNGVAANSGDSGLPGTSGGNPQASGGQATDDAGNPIQGVGNSVQIAGLQDASTSYYADASVPADANRSGAGGSNNLGGAGPTRSSTPGAGGSNNTGGVAGPKGGGSSHAGGAAGAGTPGTGGAKTVTCGNGKLDTGEACEGSNLNGATCASLGFESGTLSCLSSCQFDTTACTGQLTLTVNASRSSCSAPCGVFFDATTTTGLMGDDHVIANFNWAFDSTNVDPSSGHKQSIGFVAAHVFEIPGTYQVSVRVRDQAGHAGSATIPITVSALSGTTLYVASNGSDQNSGTSTTQPLATLAAALKKLASGTSILLRRGDTFDIGNKSISIQGPCLLGAYTDPAAPSTAAPTLNSTLAGGYASIFSLSGTDARIVDLHIVSAGASNGISFPSAPHGLVERVDIEGLGYVDESNQTVGEMFDADRGSSPAFIVDTHLHDFQGYGIYGDSAERLAFIGNTIERFGGGDHGVRLAGGKLHYVAENTVMSNDSKSAMSAITIRGDNTDIVVVNNRVNRLIEFTPQNESSVEHVKNGLAEGNIVNDARGTNAYPAALGISGQHIVARNNILVNAPMAVLVFGWPQLPDNFVDQVFVYNNTSYYFPANAASLDSQASFVSQTDTTGSLVVRNNIFAQGLKNGTLVTGDKKGTCTEDHNLSFGPNSGSGWKPASGTGSLVGDPKFASTDANAGNPFQLSAGSAAIDVGADLPVYQDFAGTPRPTGTKWDIGAAEYKE